MKEKALSLSIPRFVSAWEVIGKSRKRIHPPSISFGVSRQRETEDVRWWQVRRVAQTGTHFLHLPVPSPIDGKWSSMIGWLIPESLPANQSVLPSMSWLSFFHSALLNPSSSFPFSQLCLNSVSTLSQLFRLLCPFLPLFTYFLLLFLSFSICSPLFLLFSFL